MRSATIVPSLAAAVCLALLAGGTPAIAQERSADDLAQALANPNATLGFLSFPLDYIRYGGDQEGAGDQAAWKLSAQPSFPYPIAEGTNIFFRPLIPIVFQQPVPAGAGGFEDKGVALGDISFDLAIGRTFPSGMVLIGGVVGTMPTATDDALGLDQWLLGPEAFVGYGARWGFVGVLVTHQWDIAGEDAYSTSITGGQYFYTVNLPNAWQIQAQPSWSYNHNVGEGDAWTVPLGIGVSKLNLVGQTPVKFSLQYWNYVEAPAAFGPKHLVRFTLSPVVPLPW